MTNIFNLKDNPEDLQEEIDIDDLYEKKRKHDLNNLELFNKILNRIHDKIKKTSKLCKDATNCWFVVPEVMIGIPRYDHAGCIAYVTDKLRTNGFNIRYFHPNTLLISWNHWIPGYIRDEIKKKMNKNIDSFGNIIEEKQNETNEIIDNNNNNNNNSIFGIKTPGSKNKNDNVKSTNNYKPIGNFIYNTDFFKK